MDSLLWGKENRQRSYKTAVDTWKRGNWRTGSGEASVGEKHHC